MLLQQNLMNNDVDIVNLYLCIGSILSRQKICSILKKNTEKPFKYAQHQLKYLQSNLQSIKIIKKTNFVRIF